jgi:D-3-phosphoglycerate dehydrogenase
VSDVSAATVLVTPRSFGVHDPELRRGLERAVGEVRYNRRGRALTAGELREEVGDVDGVIAGLDQIDATVFLAAPSLKVIARYGVGVSNVDLEAARRHGVVVTNTPGANSEAVAELTIGFLFALARSIVQANSAAHAGRWTPIEGMEIAGKTVGILGAGRIGLAVARRAAALGCRVLAYDPYAAPGPLAAAAVQSVSLEQVLAESHVLSLHLPLTGETRGLVDAGFLAQVRPGVLLINTARGELIVEDDLLHALESGRVGGAALDTLTQEPAPIDHPLLRNDRVLVTPHVGAHTREATNAMGRMATDDLIAVLSGAQPRFPVSRERTP